MPWKCCGTSVGVLLTDAHRQVLMIERATVPVGIAPVAGHALDEHTSYLDAAVQETVEEVGLKIQHGDVEPLLERWFGNRCGAQIPFGDPPGHAWQVMRVRHWSGQIVLEQREAKNARWYDPAEIQRLAERTAAHAHGRIGEQEFRREPGLEPVWVAILHHLDQLRLAPAELDAIERLYQTPPR